MDPSVQACREALQPSPKNGLLKDAQAETESECNQLKL